MSETATLAEKNRQHWDQLATSYDDKAWAQDIVRAIAAGVEDNREWIGVDWVKKDASGPSSDREVRMLDYACGPGNVAHTLFPYVTQVRGIDLSAGMAAEFNRRAGALGLRAEEFSAVQGDLLADPATQAGIAGQEFWGVDLLTCSLAFHHIEDSALACGRFVERLRPGRGVLCIVDLVPDGRGHGHGHGHEDGHGHGGGHGHVHNNDGPGNSTELTDSNQSPWGQYPSHASDSTIAHGGFTKERMESLLKAAGCVDVKYMELDKELNFGPDMANTKRRVFMVRGRRAE